MIGFSILAGAAVKGSIVLAIACAASFCLRKRSAASRHLVWTAAAAALVALPLLSGVLPALRVPAAPDGPMAMFRVFSSGAASPAAAPSAAAAPARRPAIPAREFDFRSWAVLLWAAGAAFGVLQMILASAALARVRRASRPLDAGGLPAALGIRHAVDVRESPEARMPMTFGLFRPAVLLPAGASEWPAERLRIVLLHELAHVRRGDVASHLMARAALALYWWHPLAWHAWRAFVRERERATDDLVLHAGERASDYAAHLLEIASASRPHPATAWAALAMARRSELEGRLLAILDAGADRRPSGRRAAAIAAMAAIAIVAPFAAVQAQDPNVPPELDATLRAAAAQKNHEMLDRAAAAYEKISRFDVARTLLERSLALRQDSGEAAYAAGLVKLGDLAVTRRHLGEASSFYTKAVTLGDRVEAVPALLFLGARAFDRSDREASRDYFERALRLAPSGSNAGRALTWLAVLRQSAPGGEPEAELLYQKALAAMGSQAPEAINTLANYARLVRRQGRGDEADRMDALAAQIRKSAGAGEAAVSSTSAVRVGNGVSAPRLLYKVEPQYTEEARAAKLAGTVLLYVEVEADGVARNVRVVRGLDPGLDEQAVQAIRKWRFAPGEKDGMPVTVAATIEVNFRLL